MFKRFRNLVTKHQNNLEVLFHVYPDKVRIKIYCRKHDHVAAYCDILHEQMAAGCSRVMEQIAKRKATLLEENDEYSKPRPGRTS